MVVIKILPISWHTRGIKSKKTSSTSIIIYLLHECRMDGKTNERMN